jgi:hypothetical protein
MELSGPLQAPTALPPGRSPSRHCMGGSLGAEADLDCFGEEKFLSPVGNRTSLRASCS